jgi:hypothetical protein
MLRASACAIQRPGTWSSIFRSVLPRDTALRARWWWMAHVATRSVELVLYHTNLLRMLGYDQPSSRLS